MAYKRRDRLPQLKSEPRRPAGWGSPSRLPQISRYETRRYGWLALDRLFGAGRSRSSLPQLSRGRGRSRGMALARGVIGFSIIVLLLIVTAPHWVPVVSGLIPDRYIMAYAPEPLQQMAFSIDVSEQVPTPSAGGNDAASLLSALPSPTPAMTATPLPTPQSAAAGGGYIQPTLVPLAPTPTVTPASSVQVDPRAQDRENSADLSQVRHLLTGFDWEQQGYNNCGPASIRVYMSYWGVAFSEEEAAAFLKPNPEDPNVRPDEMAAFAETKGYLTLVRVNGTIDRLKQIIMAGYPVMIETGYDPEPETIGWTSHYLTLVGFTDEGFIAMDTYRRPNWFYPFEEIETYWRQFNRKYIIIHRPDQAVAVASLMGTEIDDRTMWENARYTAQLELSLNRSDPYGWHNLGSSLVALGEYDRAVSAFDEARRLGLPWRFMWYQFDAYEAYMQVGRYDDVIALADAVLEKKGSEEAYYYRGIALIAQGDKQGGRRQLELALRFNKNYEAARLALDALGTG